MTGDGKIYPKLLPKRILLSLNGSEVADQADSRSSSRKKDKRKGKNEDTELKPEDGNIIFTKIEDIPTRPPTPKVENKFEKNTFVSSDEIASARKQPNHAPKLSFEISVNSKKIPTPAKISTFAELSKKLGNRKKIRQNGGKGFFYELKEEKKLPPLEDHIQDMKNDDLLLDDIDKELEESFKQFKDPEIVISLSRSVSRSRSRSGSKSRSRSSSRSGSGSDYSRSSSRSYSKSRSRSRSYSSRSRSNTYSLTSSRSRSRSRSNPRPKSRSPSIQRRKGSPSFLDRRRITSARKRPVPYQRRTPSPSPSSSSRSSSSSSRSGRSWSRD